jgi:hypothetical protein
MPTSGGTFTGPVTMGSTLTLVNSTPANPLDAASKAYVDSMSASAGVTTFNTRAGAVTLTTKDITDAGGLTAAVTTFNTRAGAVTLVVKDITDAGGAPVQSPTLLGIPAAPTAAPGTKTTQIATTAFVTAAVVASTTGVSTFNTRSGAVVLSTKDITDASGAPLASPAFTGTPTAPTPTAGDNDTSIATTAFVTSAIAGFAPKASPAFTGNPTAPTPTAGDNDTSIATTAFVTNALSTAPSGGVTKFNGRLGDVTFSIADAALVGTYNNIGRNYLHNPLFNIAQRGAGPFTANGVISLDRWKVGVLGTGASISVGQLAQTDTDRAQIGDEEGTSVLDVTFVGTAGSLDYNSVVQHIENVYRLANKTVTISFWARAATAGTRLGVSLTQLFGNGGSPSGEHDILGQSVTLSTTWARYSVTLTVLSVAGRTLGTNGDHSTAFIFWFSSGFANSARSGNVGVQSGNVRVWGAQLERGIAPTPLERPDIRYDLTNCQRYYQTVDGYVSESTGTAGWAVGRVYPFVVPMRSTPVMTLLTAPVYANASGAQAQPIGSRGWQMIGIPTEAFGWSAQATFGASADF